MVVEYISETDYLNDGRVKINKFAIDPANRAEKNSENAYNSAKEASDVAEAAQIEVSKLRSEIDDLIINSGTSDAEVVQARTNIRGQKFPLLKDRLNSVDEDIQDLSINVRWYGAVGDGIVDDTEAIQAAIRAAKVANTKVFIPDGNYKLTKELILLEGTHLMCGENAVFLRYHNKNFTLNFELHDAPKTQYNGNGNITIDGGFWDFYTNNQATGQCFFFCHSHNVMIRNAHVKNINNGHAIEINSSDGVTVQDCVFEGYIGEAYRGAIQIDLDKEGAFGDLYVDHQSFDYTPAKNISVARCKFISSELGSWGRAVESHSAVVDKQFERITISDCEIHDCLTVGIRGYNWTDVVIKNNRLYNCASGIVINTIIERPEDTIDSNGVQTNMSVNTSKIVITGNTIVQSKATEQYVSSISLWGQNTGKVTNVTVSDNVCEGGKWSGIFIYKTDDFTVSGNVVNDVSNNGISVSGSKRGSISANVISNCGSSGIYVSKSNTDEAALELFSENVLISANAISECDVHGIHIVDNSIAVIANSNTLINTSKVKKEESVLIGLNSTMCQIANNTINDGYENTRAILATAQTTDISIHDNKVTNPTKYTQARYIANDSAITTMPFQFSSGITEYTSSSANKVSFSLIGSRIYCKGAVKGVDTANKQLLKLPIPPQTQQYMTGISTTVSGRTVITRLTVKTDGYLYLENNSEAVYNASDFVTVDFNYAF
ncbi:right-handed parallel beta-helix repeat-containing protein [Vibrio parahaemolyticus]|nr:right-handed parallel beta-helix repeat-containing protein [Vibrio parahaemolyticus]